jgi:hypothetical protein
MLSHITLASDRTIQTDISDSSLSEHSIVFLQPTHTSQFTAYHCLLYTHCETYPHSLTSTNSVEPMRPCCEPSQWMNMRVRRGRQPVVYSITVLPLYTLAMYCVQHNCITVIYTSHVLCTLSNALPVSAHYTAVHTIIPLSTTCVSTLHYTPLYHYTLPVSAHYTTLHTIIPLYTTSVSTLHYTPLYHYTLPVSAHYTTVHTIIPLYTTCVSTLHYTTHHYTIIHYQCQHITLHTIIPLYTTCVSTLHYTPLYHYTLPVSASCENMRASSTSNAVPTPSVAPYDHVS